MLFALSSGCIGIFGGDTDSASSETDAPGGTDEPDAPGETDSPPDADTRANCTSVWNSDSDNSGTNDWRMTYLYNASGDAAHADYEATANGTVDMTTDWEYRTDLQLDRYIIDYSPFGSADVLYDYIYDADRLVQLVIDIDGDGAPDAITDYEYDNQAQIAFTIEDWDANGTPDGMWFYDYDADGHRILEQMDESMDGSIDRYIYYSYDGDHLVQTLIDWEADGNPDYVSENTWDGNTLTRVDVDSDGDGTVDVVYHYAYDSMHRVIAYTMDDGVDGDLDSSATISWECP